MSQQSPKPRVEYDPVFLHSRREAVLIFILWVVCLLWSVPYCYIHGFPTDFDPNNFSTVWGIPSWLFWGIGFPWILADIFTTWFCFFFMKDDDLGTAADELENEAKASARGTSEDAS